MMKKNFKHKKRYRLKPIPAICALLAVAIIVGGIYFLFFKESPYKEYQTYVETNKNYGEVKNYEEDNDNFYISIFIQNLMIKI